MIKRIGALIFFGLLGGVLLIFTALDVLILFLARKRRSGLGARPMRGMLWQVLLSPTRHTFWAVGFWIALAALMVMLLRLFSGGVMAAS